MIGVTWNCRGLGNPRAVLALKDLVWSHQPNFIFLVETLVNQNKIDAIKKSLGYNGCFSVDCDGRSGGLAFLWKNSQFSLLSFSSHHIDMQCTMDDGLVW